VLAQPPEASFPEPIDAHKPALYLAEPVPFQAVVALAAGAPLGDDADATHQPQVLGHGGPADGHGPGEVGHALLAAREALEQLPADGVREDPEDVVDRGRTGGRHLGIIREENLTCPPAGTTSTGEEMRWRSTRSGLGAARDELLAMDNGHFARARPAHPVFANCHAVNPGTEVGVVAPHTRFTRHAASFFRVHRSDGKEMAALRQYPLGKGRGGNTAYALRVAQTGAAPQFASELRRWRRSRRISQLELALRAGTTQRHVSYVEQGRSRPGRTMVLRLAESLELSLRERNALLLTAGYAPVFAESRLDDALGPVRDALHRILAGHMPYPAVVAGPGGRLVAANAATDVLTEGAAPDLLAPPVNVLRLAVHPDGMGPRVENLAEWGRHIIDNVRAN
jgi:transcriptional regulator with XRE-family HTH domain